MISGEIPPPRQAFAGNATEEDLGCQADRRAGLAQVLDSHDGSSSAGISARPARRRSASRKSPSRLRAVGMTQHSRPAALAAESPRSESSTATHSAGLPAGDLERPQVGLGVGLGPAHVVAADDDLEEPAEAGAGVDQVEVVAARARHDAHAEPPGERLAAPPPHPASQTVPCAAARHKRRLRSAASPRRPLRQPGGQVPAPDRVLQVEFAEPVDRQLDPQAAPAPAGSPGSRGSRCRPGPRRCPRRWWSSRMRRRIRSVQPVRRRGGLRAGRGRRGPWWPRCRPSCSARK